MRPTILVYGWYFRGNVGDNLFVHAFKHLFPKYDFYFVDHITAKSLENVSAVFFGGGSFLYAEPNISEDGLNALENKPIFYIGVGTETDIHSTHLNLMKSAKLIATRSLEKVEKIKKINQNTMYCPDIVYSLQKFVHKMDKLPKSILILSNIETVPRYSDPQWKSASWEFFKSEFAQFLDVIQEQNYNINFWNMCKNTDMDDNWAATEIVNKMRNRKDNLINTKIKTIESITKFISQFDMVITQRYHGIVLAEMARVPYLAISHHDKLKNAYPLSGKIISFYGATKQILLDEFYSTINMKFTDVLPIESNIFEELKKEVDCFISNGG